jgi:hypothetical protein
LYLVVGGTFAAGVTFLTYNRAQHPSVCAIHLDAVPDSAAVTHNTISCFTTALFIGSQRTCFTTAR